MYPCNKNICTEQEGGSQWKDVVPARAVMDLTRDHGSPTLWVHQTSSCKGGALGKMASTSPTSSVMFKFHLFCIQSKTGVMRHRQANVQTCDQHAELTLIKQKALKATHDADCQLIFCDQAHFTINDKTFLVQVRSAVFKSFSVWNVVAKLCWI